jgi:hypothetical protein
MTLELNQHGELRSEIACIRCGYLLIGLAPDAVCPECAYAIRDSIAAHKASSWPKDWLVRISNGLSLIVGAVVAGILFEIALTLFTYNYLFHLSIDLSLNGKRALDVVLQVTCLVCISLLCMSAMMLTFSQAASAIAADRPAPRRLSRIGFIAGAFVTAALFALRFKNGISLILFAIGMLIGLAAMWNLCIWVSRMVRCFPDMRLARRILLLRWILLICIPLASCEMLNIWPILAWMPIKSRMTWNRTVVIFDTLILTGRGAMVVMGVVVILIVRGIQGHVARLCGHHQ